MSKRAGNQKDAGRGRSQPRAPVERGLAGRERAATRLRAEWGSLGVGGLENPGHRAVHGDRSGGGFETLDPDVPELAHELGRDLSGSVGRVSIAADVTVNTVPSPDLSTPASIAW